MVYGFKGTHIHNMGYARFCNPSGAVACSLLLALTLICIGKRAPDSKETLMDSNMGRQVD